MKKQKQPRANLKRQMLLEEEVSFIKDTYLPEEENLEEDEVPADEEPEKSAQDNEELQDSSESPDSSLSEPSENSGANKKTFTNAGLDRGNCAVSETLEDDSEQIASELSSYELGRRGERAARRFLESKDFEILDLNWSCIAGEADIICLDGDTLCFVEVKTRRGTATGFPEEAITARKRARYEKIAACYLKEHDFVDVRVRFDVISIMVIADNRAFLRMHTNAFSEGSLR